MSAPIQSSSGLLEILGRRSVVLGLIVGLGLSTLVMPLGLTQAAERLLDEARAAGIVGERYDGYAVVRDASASTNVHNVVAEVNAKRQAVYQQRAQSEGASVDAVGRVYAQEILEAAPAGTWFLLDGGGWVQK